MRIAFSGSSGTGKSVLAQFVADTFKIPFNPIGSRSVAAEMGFDSPYDVDRAGKRNEFQRKLITDKMEWEARHESFVTDRSTCDNLAYTMLHDVYSIDAGLYEQVCRGMARYSLIFWCPEEVFCNVGNDPARVADPAYQKLYDAVLQGLLHRGDWQFVVHPLNVAGIEKRKIYVLQRIRLVEGC